MLHDHNDGLEGFLVNHAVRTTIDGSTVAEYPIDSHYRTDATSYDRHESAQRLPYDLDYERAYARGDYNSLPYEHDGSNCIHDNDGICHVDHSPNHNND